MITFKISKFSQQLSFTDAKCVRSLMFIIQMKTTQVEMFLTVIILLIPMSLACQLASGTWIKHQHPQSDLLSFFNTQNGSSLAYKIEGAFMKYITMKLVENCDDHEKYMRINIDLLTHYQIEGTHELKQVPIIFSLYAPGGHKYSQEQANLNQKIYHITFKSKESLEIKLDNLPFLSIKLDGTSGQPDNWPLALATIVLMLMRMCKLCQYQGRSENSSGKYSAKIFGITFTNQELMYLLYSAIIVKLILQSQIIKVESYVFTCVTFTIVLVLVIDLTLCIGRSKFQIMGKIDFVMLIFVFIWATLMRYRIVTFQEIPYFVLLLEIIEAIRVFRGQSPTKPYQFCVMKLVELGVLYLILFLFIEDTTRYYLIIPLIIQLAVIGLAVNRGIIRAINRLLPQFLKRNQESKDLPQENEVKSAQNNEMQDKKPETIQM